MSTEQQSAAEREADLRERVERFVARNFPQIAMHGGNHAIRDLDAERGEVTIELGGACSGCGISPMTVQALQHRLVEEIPEIRTVIAETESAAPRGFDPDDVPF